MGDREPPWWANSPIVVLPISFLAMGLCFVPFVLTTTDRAAEFWGAFMAALVAAAAAFSGYFVQAAISKREKASARQDEDKREAAIIYSYLVFALSQVRRALRIFENMEFKEVTAGTKNPQDCAEMRCDIIRKAIPKILVLEFERAVARNSFFDIQTSLEIGGTCFDISVEAASYRIEMGEDGYFPTRQNIEGTVRILKRRDEQLTSLIDRLTPVLKAKGVLH